MFASSDRTIISAGRVLVGDNLELMRNAAVAVKDGKIEKILSEEELSKIDRSCLSVMDLGDVTILPGMIECHNHVSLDARRVGYLQRMELSACELTLDGLKNLSDDLMSGVTTARSLGDRYYIDCVLRDKVRAGEVVGPDIIASGVGMRSSHGHGYVGLPFTGPEEFRRKSRENLSQNVDMLKLYITGGGPRKDGSVPCFLTGEEVRIVTNEARNADIPTAVHCIGGLGVRCSVENGVDVIEHAYCITDDDLEVIIKNDRWIDLTAGVFLDPVREVGYTEEFKTSVLANREKIAKTTEKILESGVKYAIGTDAFHGNLYRELMLMVNLGASSREALAGVGRKAAEMCRRQDSIGSIKVGLDADIIAVEGDPIADIACMENVRFVMKKGIVYKNI